MEDEKRGKEEGEGSEGERIRGEYSKWKRRRRDRMRRGGKRGGCGVEGEYIAISGSHEMEWLHLVHLLKDQLSVEATARLEAQARDSLLEITFRSTVPPVLCDPTTPRPQDHANLNLPALGINMGVGQDGTVTPLFSSSLPLGSPLGREQCLLKLECFRFLPGPPTPDPRPPTPPQRRGQNGVKGQEGSGVVMSSTRDEVLGSLELLRFRESGIASEYESTEDSDERE
ncbi:unnamed protein product, partial [Coregonus sp. 'balchen']